MSDIVNLDAKRRYEEAKARALAFRAQLQNGTADPWQPVWDAFIAAAREANAAEAEMYGWDKRAMLQ
jgi:hypothetical protein